MDSTSSYFTNLILKDQFLHLQTRTNVLPLACVVTARAQTLLEVTDVLAKQVSSLDLLHQVARVRNLLYVVNQILPLFIIPIDRSINTH